MSEPSTLPVPVPAPAAVATGLTDRLMNLAWAALGAVPLGTAFVLTPSEKGVGTHQQLGLPPCTFLWLTGLPCPFCGMTTSWTHAAHGNILSSFTTQPMGLVLFALDAVIVVWLLGRVLRGSAGFRPDQFLGSLPVRLVWALFASTMVAWVYKILAVTGWL